MSSAPAPELAVVIISHGPRPTLSEAVRSVLEQDVPQEIVVVHTGPGDPRPVLTAAGLDVRVVMSERSLLAGGARNLGISTTSAPLVAFLADDCLALPGWSRERIMAHRRGADAVASCLLSHRPTQAIALAVHLSLFIRRMPGMPEDEALRYGVSYRRTLFDSYGAFRDDLQIGEDTEFNARFASELPIAWTTSVVTAHHGIDRLIPALVDQFRRGRRRHRYERDHGSRTRPSIPAIVRARMGFVDEFGEIAVGPELVGVYRRGRPVIRACIIAYALGRRSPLFGR